MGLTIFEWRKIILQFFVAGEKIHFVCTKERFFEEYPNRIDENTNPAFQSLIYDNLLSVIPSKDKTFYGLNLDKLDEIEEEVFTVKEEIKQDVIQKFDKNFSNYSFVFESETDRNLPNKGKYYHFTKSSDDSFWISVVKTKGSSKSNKLILGSLNDPKSRLFKIRKAILTISHQTGKDIFIKKNVEDIEPNACGNSRQLSRAALDILEYLGLIRAIKSKGRSPIYVTTKNFFLGFEEQYIKQLKNSRQASLEEFLEQKD